MDLVRSAPMAPLVMVVFVVFALTTDNFATWGTTQLILRDSAILIIAAMGATYVFLTGGLDLSVGATIALSSVTSAFIMRDTESVLLGVMAGVIVGILIGLINGLFIAYAKLTAFVITLGTLLMVRAAGFLTAAWVAGEGQTATSVGGLPPEALAFGRGSFMGIPNVFVVALLILIFTTLLLQRTTIGRRLYLLGDNQVAAVMSGIDIRRVKFLVYTFAGLMSGIAGCLLTTRLGSGNPASGDAILLQVIAATIIGGTSLTGGRGGTVRTIFGALLIGVLDRGVNMLGFAFWDQMIMLGVVILIGTAIASRVSVEGRRAGSE